jgi:hypothetical protein
MGIGAPWYPDVEPGDLRRAAQAYRDLGTAIDEASRTAGPGMQQFFAANQTDTLTPYREAWTALADPSACPGGYLGQMANGCRQMATGLDEAAKGIEELRDKIDAMVAGGAAVTIGVGLITFGIGSAVAGAATASAVVVTTSLVISSFLTRVAIVAAFEFVGGYLTSMSLQALRQQIFDPGKPIDFDQGEALTFGAVSAGTGGLLYGAPGGIRMFANQRYLNSLPTLKGNNLVGYLGEAATKQQLLPLGPSKIVTQRQFKDAAGTGRPSRADIIIDNPSPRIRALWPDSDDAWTLAVGEVKTTDLAKEAYNLLTPNQQAVLVPLAASGGRMSGPLADLLKWRTTIVAPGQASQLLVFRIGRGDFLRMPISLRRLLNSKTFEQILDGETGMRNARRMASFLKTVVVVIERIK